MEKLFTLTFLIPPLTFILTWIYIDKSFDGHAAFGAALYIVPPMVLCILYFLIGLVLIFFKKRKNEEVSRKLKIAVLVSSIMPTLLFLRERYLDFQTWG